jgi:hypothetical protein
MGDKSSLSSFIPCHLSLRDEQAAIPSESLTTHGRMAHNSQHAQYIGYQTEKGVSDEQ